MTPISYKDFSPDTIQIIEESREVTNHVQKLLLEHIESLRQQNESIIEHNKHQEQKQYRKLHSGLLFHISRTANACFAFIFIFFSAIKAKMIATALLCNNPQEWKLPDKKIIVPAVIIVATATFLFL